jgi:hypothetical protein
VTFVPLASMYGDELDCYKARIDGALLQWPIVFFALPYEESTPKTQAWIRERRIFTAQAEAVD